MNTLKLNEVLEGFGKLPNEEKEYAVEIINKQMVEENRKKIIKRVGQARLNQKKGNFKEGSINDLYEDLEND